MGIRGLVLIGLVAGLMGVGVAALAPAPVLAQQARGCLAMQVFLAYSAYGMFDKQRVRDDTAYIALDELNARVFAGYAPEVIASLRAAVAELRAPGNESFRATCAALARAGPPAYRPSYMISRGMRTMRSDDDWVVEGFEAEAAWERTLVDVNGCDLG